MLEVTKEVELISLLPATIIHLGWMGFVYYVVHSVLSGVLFHAALLLFVAEFIVLYKAMRSDETDEQHDFIATGLHCLELYFAFIYLVYCADIIYRFLLTL